MATALSQFLQSVWPSKAKRYEHADGAGRRAASGAAHRQQMQTGGRGYRREAMSGIPGIQGGAYGGTIRRPEIVPGAYAQKNLIDRDTLLPFSYLPGFATQQELESGMSASMGGRPARAYPVQAPQSFGPQLSMDQQVSMIAQRRAQGLDGRLPKYALVRDISSDFNKPTDGRPSPYDARQLQSAVNRVWTQTHQIDARTAESAGQTIDSVTQLVQASQPDASAPPSPAIPMPGTAQFYSEHYDGRAGAPAYRRRNQFSQAR